MARSIQIQIPSSCHENWQEMHARKEGRYCDSCKKTVVDFSAMSDAELMAYLRSHSGATCGRFAPEQLQRELLVPRRPLPWVRYFFQVSIPAFLLSLKASAQEQRVITPTEVAPVHAAENNPQPAVKETTVNGLVRDSNGAPVPFASVILKGTRNGVTTDAAGNFSIHVAHLPATLSISCVGFSITEIPVSADSKSLSIIMAGRNETEIMGEVVIVRYRKKRRQAAKPREELAQKTASILAFPNPVASGTRLKINGRNLEAGAYRIELYSMSGQLVNTSSDSWTDETSELSITTSGLIPGTYLLRVTCEKSGKGLSQQVVLTN
jgi:hypothetical protein